MDARCRLTTLLCALALAGCGLTEQQPEQRIAGDPPPPPPLGSLTRVTFGSPLERAERPGAPLRLDLELLYGPIKGGIDAPAHLAAQLRSLDGELLAQAVAPAPLDRTRASPVALTLQPETTPDAHVQLDLFLVGEDAALDAPLAPRSPVVRAELKLGAASGALVRHEPLALGRETPGSAVHCEDGRVVVAGARGVAVLEPEQPSAPRLIALPEGRGPLSSLRVDWRCTRAYAAAGEHFVVFDLLDQEVDFDEPVPGLLDVVLDVNPRYVMLLLADGRLRRYFLRDGEWSDYNGQLPAAPLRDGDGELVLARDDARLVIATSGGGLCVVTDQLKLAPHCITLPVEPVALALVPYGFADEVYAPHDVARAGEWYEDDLAAREDTAPALGAVLVVDAARELGVYGLDAGFVAARHTLDLDVLALRPGAHGEVVALGATQAQVVDALDAGAGPLEPLLPLDALVPSEATSPAVSAPPARLWPSPDRSHAAWFDARGLHVADRSGERVAFVADLAPGRVVWSADGTRLVALGEGAATVVRPGGVQAFVPESSL